MTKESVKESLKRARQFRRGILPQKKPKVERPKNEGAVTCEIIAEPRWNASTRYHLRLSTCKGVVETKGKEYGDFELLYKRVKPKHSMIPPLPCKNIDTSGKADASKAMRIDRLRRGMEKFLNELLSRPETAGDSDVCSFVRLHPEVLLFGLGGPQDGPSRPWYVEHLEETGTIRTGSSKQSSRRASAVTSSSESSSEDMVRTNSVSSSAAAEKARAATAAQKKRMEAVSGELLSPATALAVQFAKSGGLLANTKHMDQADRGRGRDRDDNSGGKRSSSATVEKRRDRSSSRDSKKCTRSLSISSPGEDDLVAQQLNLQQLQQQQQALSKQIAKQSSQVQQKLFEQAVQSQAKMRPPASNPHMQMGGAAPMQPQPPTTPRTRAYQQQMLVQQQQQQQPVTPRTRAYQQQMLWQQQQQQQQQPATPRTRAYQQQMLLQQQQHQHQHQQPVTPRTRAYQQQMQLQQQQQQQQYAQGRAHLRL